MQQVENIDCEILVCDFFGIGGGSAGIRSDYLAFGQVNAAGRPYAAPNVGFWGNGGQSWILASSGSN
jgi:hypothetical protein